MKLSNRRRFLSSLVIASMIATTLTGTASAAPPLFSCDTAVTSIGAVQGSGLESPLAGTVVTIRGQVVGDYEGSSPNLRGFYLQDLGDGDEATSDAVFVFDDFGGNPDLVALGDTVEVTGRVSEFQGQTQVTAATLGACTTPITVISAAEFTLPLDGPDSLERFEGMVVRVPQALFVTETFQLGRFGEVVVSSVDRQQQPTSLFRPGTPEAIDLQDFNDRNRLIIDDGTNIQNPDPIVFGRDGNPLTANNTLRAGDQINNPTGVLTYTWAGNAASGNAFRLRPIGALFSDARFNATNPRPTTPPDVGGTLKVAGANLLNWFNTFTGCTLGTAGAVTDCRGAENAVELERQANKEVSELNGLGADVIGLVEVENDGYGPTSALADLVGRLNAGANTWGYIDVDTATGTVDAAGSDAIKVAVIYRAAAVTPVADGTHTDTGAGELWDRVPVAQTFTRNADGERFTVVVNHFKSKGSCPATDPAVDPDADQGDGQSCWNARRVAQADRLSGWLTDTVIPAAGDPDVLLVGDYNSYAAEDPIVALKEAGYVDLFGLPTGATTLSYGFDGQWGSLDYGFGSPSLVPQTTGSAEWHINADEPAVLDYNTNFKSTAQQESLYAPDTYRNSDHDPVLVGLDLFTAPVATTVTLQANTPAVFGADVNYLATITRTSNGSVITDGTVQFFRGNTALGPPTAIRTDYGNAVSPNTRAVIPGGVPITARYSGTDRYAASSGKITQVTTYGLRIVEPTPGSAINPGSTVPIRYQLTNSVGNPLPDGLSVLLALTCQSTVTVTGASTLRPTCGRYDLRSNTFTVQWRSWALELGPATATVKVRYADSTPPTTASVTVILEN